VLLLTSYNLLSLLPTHMRKSSIYIHILAIC
jgi:hypothetical protein